MATKRVTTPPDADRLPLLPSPPRKGDMQTSIYFTIPAVANTLARHLDALREDTTTLVAGNGYICPTRNDWQGSPYPNMVVAFNVDTAAVYAANAYIISEIGKPLDLVLEIGYDDDTYLPEYPDRKDDYMRFGIPEYWRYDHTGGKYYGVALDSYRLAQDGSYRPIDMCAEPNGVIWGYSEALELSLCWTNRHLRFWDRKLQRYLPTPSEIAEARANAEAARARQLEEEVRRLRGE